MQTTSCGRGLIARPYLLDAIMQKEDGEDHRKNTGKASGSSMTVFTGIIKIFRRTKCTFPHEGIVELYGTRLYQLCQISEKDQKNPSTVTMGR